MAKRATPAATAAAAQAALASLSTPSDATTTPAVFTAPAAGPTDPTIQRIKLLQLTRSHLNPRRTFDDDAIRDLAESIAVQGLLQNLVARKDDEQPIYWIVAGERRYRALQLLDKEGRLPAELAEHGVPCRIIEANDAQHLALALLENLQRVDVNTMEEASAFAQLQALDPVRWTTEEIAKAIGKIRATGDEQSDRKEIRSGVRFVQQRLALAEKLAPASQEALHDGRITFSHARVLTSLTHKLQIELLSEIRDGVSADQLRKMAFRGLFPVERAIFVLSDYKGTIIEDEDGGRFFDNRDEFIRLQKLAIDARRRAFQAHGAPWVKVTGRDQPSSYHSWDYTTRRGDKTAGVVIDVEWDWEVKVYEHLVPNSSRGKSAQGTTAKADPEPFTKTHYTHARQRKTAAMQDSVCHQPMMAMRLTCLALLGGTSAVHIKGEAHESDDKAIGLAAKARVESFFARLGSACKHGFEVSPYGIRTKGHFDQAEAWMVLAGMADDQIVDLFAGLVALRCGTFNGYATDIGDAPVALAIADSLGLMGQEHLNGLVLRPEDLEGVRKDKMAMLARLAGVTEVKFSDKAGAIKQAFAAGKPHGYVLPTLRFGDKATIEAAMKKPFDDGQMDLEDAISAKEANQDDSEQPAFLRRAGE